MRESSIDGLELPEINGYFRNAAVQAVALASAIFVEPILFGRIVDTLANAQGHLSDLSWPLLLTLVGAWTGFGLFSILCGALVALHADRLEQHFEVLAHHYARSADAEKALDYLERANGKAAKANAMVEARRYFADAMALLDARGGTFLSEPVEDAGPGRCLVRTSGDSLDWPIMALGMVGADFQVISPPELLDRVHDWGQRFSRAEVAGTEGHG